MPVTERIGESSITVEYKGVEGNSHVYTTSISTPDFDYVGTVRKSPAKAEKISEPKAFAVAVLYLLAAGDGVEQVITCFPDNVLRWVAENFESLSALDDAYSQYLPQLAQSE